MSIGERIRDLREKADLSQGQLAQMMDVSRQAVSKWENDQSSPDTLKLIQLADALNTEVEFLATGNSSVKEPAPIVVNLVKTQDKIVEKIVEKPVIKHVHHNIVRTRYVRNPMEFLIVGGICFVVGLIIGLLF